MTIGEGKYKLDTNTKEELITLTEIYKVTSSLTWGGVKGLNDKSIQDVNSTITVTNINILNRINDLVTSLGKAKN